MQEAENGIGLPLDYLSPGSNFSPIQPKLSNIPPPVLTSSQAELLSSLQVTGGNFIGGETGISPSFSREELAAISNVNSFALSPNYDGTPVNLVGNYDGAPINLVGGMEMDINFSNQSSNSTSSNSSRPGYIHYPLPNSNSQPHPTVQRHHPYAHPGHIRPIPPSLAHSVSASVLPTYFANGSTSSGSAEAPSLSPSNSMNFPTTAPIPHRVHSAPSHTLSLALSSPTKTDALTRLHAMSPVEHEIPTRYDGMTGMEDGMGGGAGYEPNWEPVNNLPPQNWSGNSERDRNLIERPNSAATIKIEDSKLISLTNGGNSYFDATAFLPSLQTNNYPAPSSLASVPSTHSNSSSSYDAAIPAITLLRNRLPILEAALSISESAPGDDEEEIWKGVIGAFEELKRVITGRMESRREYQSQREGKVCFSLRFRYEC